MTLQPLDYAWLGATVLLTAFGLIRGFSGVFAFLVATVIGAATVTLGWQGFLAPLEPAWLRAAAAVVVFIVLFGVVRALVKAFVGKLLAQPADAIFGVCLGVACGALLLWTLASRPDGRDASTLARALHARLG